LWEGNHKIQVEEAVLCSRNLNFNPADKQFTVFIDEKPTTSNYGFQTCFVERVTFCAHLHTTHAETAKHVLVADTTISDSARKFNNKYISICLEFEAADKQEITLDSV
jgi:hypothetical protein